MSDKSWKDKLGEIYDGWKNYISPNEEVERIAKERAEHCAKCDHNKYNTCTLCGCPLEAKTRSTKDTNECPIGKWGPITK